MPRLIPEKRRNILFRVARNSLILVTPLIWVFGVYGAFFHGKVTIMNHRIHDTPSFIYCLLVSPFAAVLCGFAVWILFIAPFQLLFWLLDRGSDAVSAARESVFPERKSFLDPRA
jgi:hypothetical protein